MTTPEQAWQVIGAMATGAHKVEAMRWDIDAGAEDFGITTDEYRAAANTVRRGTRMLGEVAATDRYDREVLYLDADTADSVGAPDGLQATAPRPTSLADMAVIEAGLVVFEEPMLGHDGVAWYAGSAVAELDPLGSESLVVCAPFRVREGIAVAVGLYWFDLAADDYGEWYSGAAWAARVVVSLGPLRKASDIEETGLDRAARRRVQRAGLGDPDRVRIIRDKRDRGNYDERGGTVRRHWRRRHWREYRPGKWTIVEKHVVRHSGDAVVEDAGAVEVVS